MSATPEAHTIALTGAAGMMASLLRPYLAEAGHSVRLVDLAEAPHPGPSESLYVGSVANADFMDAALAGVTAVIHLGGLHREKTWEELVATNITGTQVTLEAARRNGVERVLLASSTHAVGFHPSAAAGLDTVLAPRPDTYYGVSKAAMEALGSLYADKFGMKIVSARIGTGGERPDNARTLSSWLSPADSYRLVEATLSDQGAPGHHVLWAVSANSRGWADLSAGRRIGFDPQDNAEDFASSVSSNGEGEAWDRLLGGFWASSGHQVGVDNYPQLATK
ncbi:NAD-dependent epimerase/dehydratase family protein [Arthrobacter sp. HS15c]|uniref:NAD-dependent epimerase/dehydratase family protein n=1 Tax=Arthrobacter sp. HS15c TaxID=3230279 RepID=UPI0034664496